MPLVAVLALAGKAADVYDVGSIASGMFGGATATAGPSDRAYIDEVFPEGVMLAELALIRAELRDGEKARNLTVQPDGTLATYTRHRKKFFWIETNGEAPRRYRVREYEEKDEHPIDLAEVDVEVLRGILLAVDRGDHPPLDELEAISLAPQPSRPGRLIWTLRWGAPSSLMLYADEAGKSIGTSYPG